MKDTDLKVSVTQTEDSALRATITVTDDLGYFYQTRSLVSDNQTAQRDADELLSRIVPNHPSAQVCWSVDR